MTRNLLLSLVIAAMLGSSSVGAQQYNETDMGFLNRLLEKGSHSGKYIVTSPTHKVPQHRPGRALEGTPRVGSGYDRPVVVGPLWNTPREKR